MRRVWTPQRPVRLLSGGGSGVKAAARRSDDHGVLRQHDVERGLRSRIRCRLFEVFGAPGRPR